MLRFINTNQLVGIGRLMITKLVRMQLKYAYIFFAVFLVLLIGAGFLASELKLDPSFSALVSKDSQFNINDRLLESAFEENDAIFVFISLDEKTRLKNSPSSLHSLEVEQYISQLQSTLNESNYVRRITPVEYSENGRVARFGVILVVPNKVGSFAEVLEQLEYFTKEVGTPPGVKTELTGLPVLLNRVSTLLITDNLKTIVITLILLFAILYWYFRNITMTLLTLSVPISSLIFLAAVMVLFNINITITLAAVGVLVLGLGADYSIHIATHFKSKMIDGMTHEDAISETVEELWLPITASFLTTFAGFAALILGVSPSSQNQGIVLALAILIIFGLTLFLFPLLLYLFARNIVFVHNTVFQKIRRFFAKMSIYQTHRAKTVIFIIVLITIVMMYGASMVKFSTSNSNWIPDDDPISLSFNEIKYAYGNVDSITIVVQSTESDLRNVQTMRDLNYVIAQISQIPNVDVVVSPYDDLDYDSQLVHEQITYNDSIRSQFNSDYTLTRITILSQNFGQDEAGKSPALKEIRDVLSRNSVHNAKLSLYGDSIRFEELGDSLQQDAAVTTLVGLGLVFFVASVIYASLTVGIISLVPIIVAVIWTIGLMGFLGVPFTSLSTGIISLVLGVGVDFSIHLVDSIKKFQKRGDSIEGAIKNALETSGSAIILSSVTTFFGFLALGAATLLGTQRLGWSLALSILSVFMVSIILVPAIMSLKDKQLQKKKQTKLRSVKLGKILVENVKVDKVKVRDNVSDKRESHINTIKSSKKR
jgi:uncharacterized protein